MGIPFIEDEKPRAHIMAEMEEEPINIEEYKEPMNEFISAIHSGKTDQAIEILVRLFRKIKK